MKKLEKAMHTIRLTRIGSLPSECTESRNYFDLRPVHGTSYRFERRVRRQNKPTDYLTWCLAYSSGLNLPALT